MPQRHLPDDKAAPVVADEDRLVDLEMIEQADEIAGQVLDVVGLDRLGPVGRAIAALIRRNHPNAGLAQRLDLVAPGKRDLRPAMAEDDRRRVGFRAGIVVAHANAVGLGELQRRHLDHVRILLVQLAALLRSARRRKGGLQRGEFPRQHVAEHLDMGNDVGAGDEAEIQLIAIALHGDVQRQAMGRDRYREDMQQLGARRIQASGAAPARWKP